MATITTRVCDAEGCGSEIAKGTSTVHGIDLCEGCRAKVQDGAKIAITEVPDAMDP